MSQTSLPGKQQALIRVAESRVAMLDAMSSTGSHASACVRALPVSPSIILKVGAAVGTAATVMGTLAGLRRKKKIAEKQASKSVATYSSVLSMAMQLLAPLLLPSLQKMLQSQIARSAQGRSLNL